MLALQEVELTEYAWSWILTFALHEDDDLATPAFHDFESGGRASFRSPLLEDGWSWRPTRHFYTNHCGTDSLIEASSCETFEELAPRLAPWRLLEAVRRRGEDPEEAKLAAAIFGTAVKPDALSNMHLRPDIVNVSARMRSLKTAASQIDEGRRKEVELFPVRLSWRDFNTILDLAPEYVEQWLEGSPRRTAELEHLVLRDPQVILALCEALLINDPKRGANLWRATYNTITAQVIRRIQVGDLLRLAFRVPDTPAVSDLRAEIVELKSFRSDLALFEIALAASENDKADWLNEKIENDAASPLLGDRSARRFWMVSRAQFTARR